MRALVAIILVAVLVGCGQTDNAGGSADAPTTVSTPAGKQLTVTEALTWLDEHVKSKGGSLGLNPGATDLLNNIAGGLITTPEEIADLKAIDAE